MNGDQNMINMMMYMQIDIYMFMHSTCALPVILLMVFINNINNSMKLHASNFFHSALFVDRLGI